LGATSFGAGIAGTLSARHLRSKSDLAIGVVCGAGAVAAFASAAGGAWVVLVLSITLTIPAGSLRIIPDHVGVPDLASRRDHTGQAAARRLGPARIIDMEDLATLHPTTRADIAVLGDDHELRNTASSSVRAGTLFVPGSVDIGTA
jgi:hypothetical protein